jgi:hypothetical protein
VYLRFTTQFINADNKTQTGIFHAAEFLRDHPSTLVEDEKKLWDLYEWFKKHLDVPKHFHAETKTYGWEGKSLSWFKDSAKEHIIRIREIIIILEKYDLVVERIGTKSPGRIVYEDEFQISAIPFNTNRKRLL